MDIQDLYRCLGNKMTCFTRKGVLTPTKGVDFFGKTSCFAAWVSVSAVASSSAPIFFRGSLHSFGISENTCTTCT